MARSASLNRWKDNYQYESSKKTAKYIEQKEGETERQYYYRLAKMADERMRKLQKLSKEPGFEGATKFAYAKSKYYLEMFGKRHWESKPSEDRRIFKEQIMAMRYFMTSPTSTKGGIIEVYQKRADKLNEDYGTQFTWRDMAAFFDKGLADKLARDGYGSKTALYAIGRIHKTLDDIKNGVEHNTNEVTAGPIDEAALAILRKKSMLPSMNVTAEEKKAIRKKLRQKK